MQEHYTPKGKHLTIDNRRLIERWKNENKSNREIAGLLGTPPAFVLSQDQTLIKSLSSHSFLSLTDLLFFHCSVLQLML
ncbi:transposase-like protein, IS1239 [Streptococcus pneumoniae]|nr:transposase-like protein, IS1239 [Streptococcus pneumoniae]